MPLRPHPDALNLVQRVRDEAHRFAITYHRSLRSKSVIRSVLEDVPGIGPARQRALLRRFGSLAGVLAASDADRAEVVGQRLAQEIRSVLAPLSGAG